MVPNRKTQKQDPVQSENGQQLGQLEQQLERLQRQVSLALAHVEGKQVPQEKYDNLLEECALLNEIVEAQRTILLLMLEAPVLAHDDRLTLSYYTLELNEWDTVQSKQEQLNLLIAEHEQKELGLYEEGDGQDEQIEPSDVDSNEPGDQ